MTDTEYNRTSPFISNSLHYFSKIYPYVGEFYYLCRTGNNCGLKNRATSWVVICFHFTIFVVLETTDQPFFITQSMLWFAFILLSLSYWKQHAERTNGWWLVVICFHFTIFVVLETTRSICDQHSCGLWFAFILLSLSYWKQRCFSKGWKSGVVICFHFTIFVVLETT